MPSDAQITQGKQDKNLQMLQTVRNYSVLGHLIYRHIDTAHLATVRSHYCERYPLTQSRIAHVFYTLKLSPPTAVADRHWPLLALFCNIYSCFGHFLRSRRHSGIPTSDTKSAINIVLTLGDLIAHIVIFGRVVTVVRVVIVCSETALYNISFWA